MQGIYVTDNGVSFTRPKSKKAVKEAALDDPRRVNIEGTSLFGNDYDGSLADAPDGKYAFVGPCPHTKRNFYGTIVKSGDSIKVT